MSVSFAIASFIEPSLGGIIASPLLKLGLSAEEIKPITHAFSLELLVVGLLIAFFVIVRSSLSVDRPGPVQHLAEMIHGFTGDQAEQVIGHGSERYQSYVTCIFLFVLVNNLLGLLPGVEAPTTLITTTLGLSVPTFLFYHFHGLRSQGPVKYAKHFCGPVWWMAWLIAPIEIISDLARIMSLAVRLYANMFAGDLVTLVFFSLIPIGIPVIFLGLHLFVSAIQAFVFMLLTMIYLSLATAHDH